MNWNEYRQLQESSVTGLTGGHPFEVHLVTGSTIVDTLFDILVCLAVIINASKCFEISIDFGISSFNDSFDFVLFQARAHDHLHTLAHSAACDV